jgi:hypothetical protein
MEWLNKYENLTEKQKEDFKSTINRLLSQTHVVYHNETDLKFYRFCENHPEIISEYLLLSGWKVTHHKENRIFSIFNLEDKNRLQLNIEETLFLYMLRLLYDEKLKELSLAPQITVTIQDIQDKYLALQVAKRLPTRDALKRILRIYEKHSVIHLLNGAFDNPESTLIIYPSISIVSSSTAINEFFNRLMENDITKGDEASEEINEIEID